jgi:3-dehydroquinate synthase class II
VRFCSLGNLLWQLGQHRSVSSGEELKAWQSESIADGITVLDMADWRIIPAENLVAAFQASLLGSFNTLRSLQASALLLRELSCQLPAPADGWGVKLG